MSSCPKILYLNFLDPFKIKQLSSRKNAIKLVIGVTILSFSFAGPAWWTFDIYPSASYKSGKACLSRIDRKDMALVTVLISANGALLYPVIILTIITIILIFKLIRISKDRKKLTAKPKESSAETSKELQAAITMALLGAIQCAVYIPSAIIWSTYYSFAILEFVSLKFAYILSSLGRVVLSLTIICHIYKLYLYIARIPAFRHDFWKIITCKCRY